MSKRRFLGRMRHRLTIMGIVRTPDGGGGSARADAVIATVWGRVTIIGVLESNTYSQLQQRVTHKATIRTRADVAQGQTLYWLAAGATEPEIGSTAIPAGVPLYVLTAIDADPDGRPGEFMELTLREGGNL